MATFHAGGSIPVLVTLPCDLTQWPVIKEILLEAAQSTDTTELLANLDKAHNLIHRGVFRVDPKSKQQKKRGKNIFNGLKTFVDSHLEEIERNVFFNVILPCIVQRAVAIETLKPEDGLQFIRQNEAKTVSYSRRLVASIVACGFLCLYPGRAYSKHSSLCGINYDEFFNHISNQSQKAKLMCIFQYFEKVADEPTGPEGDMVFARQVLYEENVYGMEEWMDCDYPLCRVEVNYPPGRIEDAGHTAIQIDFANKKLGGAVLVKGAVQEEIRFCTCPELQAAMLFMEEMLDHEAVVIQGFENYSKYKGYSRTLQYDGIYEDGAMRNPAGNLENTICAIDATPARRIGGAKEQYKSVNILRELNKAYAGFSKSQEMFEPKSVDSSSGEADFHSLQNLNSRRKGKGSKKETKKKKAASVDPDLSDFTSIMAQSVMDDAVEKSAAVAPNLDQTEPESAANKEENADSRAIPASDERRRSSNMSNLSSSTSGKRSSSEFSSEFEEYFEAFQQRERKVKHIVIQEEASGVAEPDPGVRVFPEQQRFSGALPKNITKPAAVRPTPESSKPSGKTRGQDNQKKQTNSASNSSSCVLSESSHMGESETDDVTVPADDETGGGGEVIDQYACETSNDIVEQAVEDAVRKVVGFLDTEDEALVPDDVNDEHSKHTTDIPSPEGKITASLYIAISRMAENMVNEGFKVVKETILAEQEEQAKEEEGPSISPELLTKIEGLADRLVGYAMKSAVTIGASHLATRRRASRARWGGHGAVTQELYLFADNFVQEVMHEALCIARGGMNVPLRSSEESWLKPSGKTRDNKIYFQAEFSSGGFRGSNPNLPRRDSVGSYRRGSYDERLGRRRTSSSGFRDSMLCDFEDELIRSNVSSPGIEMLLGFQSDKENSQKRRASEPANRTDPEFEFRGSKDRLSSPMKKRACSIDCSSSRQVVLDWLSRQSSSSTCSLSQRQRTKSRTRTTSSHLDWYAQDLLVDAFNDAFVELFGGSYYTTQANSLQSSAVSSVTDLDKTRAEHTTPSTTPTTAASMPALSRFASSLARTVVDEACHSAAEKIETAADAGPELPIRGRHPELEAAADQLAKKVMREALEIAKSEWTMHCNSQNLAHQRPIATGNWGCGAYKGDPQLKSIIQWVAASRALSPAMWYYTFGADEIKYLPKIAQKVLARGLKAGSLMRLVNQYCKKRGSKKVQGTLFDFLSEKLTSKT